MNILLLLGDGDPIVKDFELDEISVNVHSIYKPDLNRFVVRLLRRNPLTSYFTLGAWKKNIKKYDTIVCFSCDLPLETLVYLAKYVKDKKIVYYLYGRIYDNIPVEKARKWLEKLKKVPENVEVWSYDLNDCKNYGLFYNKSFYTKETADFLQSGCNEETMYDVALIANNKGRAKIIKNLYEKLKKLGFVLYFYILNIDEFENNRCINNHPMPYVEYLKIVKSSRAVLDLVNDGNYGLTLRPLEALLAKKKLITNYRDIKKMDFYNSQNIFILEERGENELKEFLELPYEEIDESIIESYSERDWIKRFTMKDKC